MKTVTLIYVGRLPRVNTIRYNPRQDYWFREEALRQWGRMPTLARGRAAVTVTRVLGRGERLMDDDNFERAFKGARDGLTNKHGGYIVDDSPTWATFVYRQDRTRRGRGPLIEVSISDNETDGSEDGHESCDV